MLRFKNYLFDLDGTLTDPGEGIKNSIRYALDKFGLACPTDDVLNKFIGPPLIDSFMTYCGAAVDEARTLLAYYREYFSVRGYLENMLYPDTVAVLEAIRAEGGRIFLATGKPELYAIKILEHFDILKYFEFCAGNDMGESRATKDAVITHVLNSVGISPEDSLMIGDRCYDVEGAQKCGLCSAAVLFGYGDREELADADFMLNSFTELLAL